MQSLSLSCMDIYREREIENPDKALREKIKRETRRETESER